MGGEQVQQPAGGPLKRLRKNGVKNFG